MDSTNSQVVDGEVVSIKAATASVQNPWESEIPTHFYEKSFPCHVQGKYNHKLRWQIARKGTVVVVVELEIFESLEGNICLLKHLEISCIRQK